jgi:hypothetical protein
MTAPNSVQKEKQQNNNKNDNDNKSNTAPKKLSIMHDLYVDLLGSLVPGLLTVILGSAAIFLAFSTVHAAIFKASPYAEALFSTLKNILTTLHWEIATVILVSSYVIGAVFFRQDPKKPDAISSLTVWLNAKDDELDGLAVQACKTKHNKKEKIGFWKHLNIYFFPHKYIKDNDIDTQFPYLFFKCYLNARGLNHLIDYIPWCPENEGTKGYRTKMFINILKIRLVALNPDMSRTIIRNEAHVRLATSVWYASTILLFLSGFILLLLGIVRCFNNEIGSNLFISASFAGVLLLFCLGMQHHLRKCIHYMRVREVIYVLETAYTVDQLSDKSSIFSELLEKSTEHDCKQCPSSKKQAFGKIAEQIT